MPKSLKDEILTDQEIRDAILKAAYKAKDSWIGVHLPKISEDCEVSMERVLKNSKYLRLNQGLVKSVVRNRVVSSSDVEITDKGIREYERKYGQK